MKMITSSQLLFLSLLAIWFTSLIAFGANTTHPDEVQALKDIAKSLGKKDWKFDVDPCSERPPWLTPTVNKVENNVTCNCSIAGDNFCHVIIILLKRQSLPGTLPPELNKLPYLQNIDLTRNYLNGTIPKEWGSLSLVNISLLGNRLTGSIPVEIANISTLRDLVLEQNQLSGNLPPELGNLTQIRRLMLSSNNFTGELPVTLAKLTTLQDFRIADNQFSGKIPDFIQSWTSLKALVIQGSGLSGPIPSRISLPNLIDLRISDLNGFDDSPFPQLNNMTVLRCLTLRNCRINGTLLAYLGTMTALKLIDLSFNELSGQIPSTYATLSNLNYIFLTGNNLTGPILTWSKKVYVDLSYNNFSIGSQGNQTCPDENVNMFTSSLRRNNSGMVSCLSFDCPKPSYSLRINCGGKQVTVNGETYEGDSSSGAPTRFHETEIGNWAFSTTGTFMDSDELEDYYTQQNKSMLSMVDAELYMNARVSPTSLTYYGFCLANGNYTVNLHFAEIMFTDDQTYSSLGRRVFDIYLQGKLVQKDFNIVEAAGGVGKAVIKSFTAIVTSKTLEIRLYWAGKGTNALPRRSVYGPLISAISIESDTPPPSENGSSISIGVEIGIAVAGAVIIILVFGILRWKGCLGRKNSFARGMHIRWDINSSQATFFKIKARES